MRIHGSPAEALAAFGLLIVFGFAFECLFLALGMVAGSAQAAQGFALLVFPLTFVWSAYVPVATMPGWLRSVASPPWPWRGSVEAKCGGLRTVPRLILSFEGCVALGLLFAGA